MEKLTQTIIFQILFQENHDFSNYNHIYDVEWLGEIYWDSLSDDARKPLQAVQTVLKLKEVTIKDIVAIFNKTNDNYRILEDGTLIELYSSKKFLEEVFIDEKKYNILLNLLDNKKNLIIQGAPGVGKTFIAKRLAYSIIGMKDFNKVMMVQFHQSYSYEDFIMGYKPSKEGFELKKGPFYKFCKKAENDSKNNYYFIIDEINRGNLSKIFGELFMLIENDKRGPKNKIQLLYNEESFFIPENLYLIGLMNTADRSLAMIDYALRRRFVFFDLEPGFDSKGFENYKSKISDDKFDELVSKIIELNEDISNDESLGEGFRIGHSYLSNINPNDIDESVRYIIEYELIPLLKEYWFDDSKKLGEWTDKLLEVVE